VRSPWFALAFALHAAAAYAQAPAAAPCQVFQNQSFDPETEEILRNESDTNCDGKFDEVISYEKNEPKRAEKDQNHDGKFDTFIDYAPGGVVLRQERDADYDGKLDQWVEFTNNKPALQKDDSNGDGKPDSVKTFVNGEPT